MAVDSTCRKRLTGAVTTLASTVESRLQEQVVHWCVNAMNRQAAAMTNHTLSIARARLKRYTRHLSEWADLAANQRLVWTSAYNEFAPQLLVCEPDKTTRFCMKMNQGERFSKLLADRSSGQGC